LESSVFYEDGEMNKPFQGRRLNSSLPDRHGAFFGSPCGHSTSGRAIQWSWRVEADFKNADEIGNAAGKSAKAETLDTELHALRRLEAVLFVAREPIPSRKMAQLADLADATQARTLARKLNELYDSQGHAFRLEEVAGGFVLLTRTSYARWLRRVEGIRQEEHQTPSALETLAIVAYRQPVLRADIESIRGVGCDEVLRQLMQRDLVRICGRSEELGRPYLYGTTKRFLQIFGLKSLERLPRADWIRNADEIFSFSAAEEPQPAVDNTPNV
jgi:segregation and condensation protein B